MIIGYALGPASFDGDETKLVAVQYSLDYHVPKNFLDKILLNNNLRFGGLSFDVDELRAENEELRKQIDELRIEIREIKERVGA